MLKKVKWSGQPSVFSGVFRDTQQYSAMFRHIEGYEGTLRNIQA